MIPPENRLQNPFSLLGPPPLDTTDEMRDILAPTPELDETFRPILFRRCYMHPMRMRIPYSLLKSALQSLRFIEPDPLRSDQTLRIKTHHSDSV